MPIKAQTHHFQASKNQFWFGVDMVAGEIAREPLAMEQIKRLCV
jgi:hypothetical protein